MWHAARLRGGTEPQRGWVVRGYACAATVCTIDAERLERRQPPDCVRRSTAVEAIASGAEGVNALGKDGTKQRRRASVDACVCAACVCACAARDEDTAKQCPSLSEMTLMRACMICKAEPPPVPVASHAPARAARDGDLLEKLALAHALELSELRRDPRIKLRAESPMQCPRRVAARRERRRTEGPGVSTPSTLTGTRRSERDAGRKGLGSRVTNRPTNLRFGDLPGAVRVDRNKRVRLEEQYLEHVFELPHPVAALIQKREEPLLLDDAFSQISKQSTKGETHFSRASRRPAPRASSPAAQPACDAPLLC